jgi:carboxypeptidase T
MRISCLIVGLFAAAVAAQPAATGPVVRHDGYRVVRVEIGSAGDVEFMMGLGADQWSHHIGAGVPADFMIAPWALGDLDESGLNYEVVIENVQSAVDAENARLRNGGAARGWFDDFKQLDQINEYMDTLAAANPGICEVVDLGQSLEGRDIRGLRIANDAFGDAACKPSVLYNACQHAREWISPMVAMYTAEQFLAGYGSDQDLTDLIDRTEILIVPVVNPDGYLYSWTNNRYWRKNRRNNGGGSRGVDLNRNWGYEWGHNNGSSGDPDSQVYRGPAPFSEPEIRRLRDWSNSRPRLAAQVDLHSYGQYILWPWGYTSQPPPYNQAISSLGNELKQIVKSVHNRTYDQGQAYTLLYPVSGSALDWFLGGVDAVNYTFELRGNDFVLPPNQIIPNGQEVFPALVRFAEWALDTHHAPSDFNMDSQTDTLDVLAFLNAWAAGDPRADFNNDGAINTLDMLAFLNAWAAGC